MPDEVRLDGRRRGRPRGAGASQPVTRSVPPCWLAAAQPTTARRRGASDSCNLDEAQPASRPTNRTEEATDAARSTRARLRASLLHPGRGQILAAIILFIVGVAGAMQIQINADDDTYASARREDLIQLLDGLSAESRRLEGEIAQLEQTRSNLRSGADTQRVAREEAEKHLTELSILAGTAPAEGAVSGCVSPIRKQPWTPQSFSMRSRRCGTPVPR